MFDGLNATQYLLQYISKVLPCVGVCVSVGFRDQLRNDRNTTVDEQMTEWPAQQVRSKQLNAEGQRSSCSLDRYCVFFKFGRTSGTFDTTLLSSGKG